MFTRVIIKSAVAIALGFVMLWSGIAGAQGVQRESVISPEDVKLLPVVQNRNATQMPRMWRGYCGDIKKSIK